MYPTITIGNLQIMTFSVVALIAVFACFAFLAYKYRNDIESFDLLRKFAIRAAVGVVVGGRMLSAITLFDGSVKDFFSCLLFGGTVFFGGLIGGMRVLYVLCKKNDIKFLYISDNVLSVLPLGQAIGRIGCYFNGCCYGKRSESIFAMNYIVDGIKIQVYPTWFIEMAGCLIIFIIIQKKKYKDGGGKATFLYLTSYPILRFFIEFLRGDEIRGIYMGLSTSQLVSILIVLITLTMKRRKLL